MLKARRFWLTLVSVSVCQIVGLWSARAQFAPDIVCTEVIRLYPLEFFDQTEWWQLCKETDNPDELLARLGDPLARIAQEPDRSVVEYRKYEGSTVGYLRITGFHGGEEFMAEFDAELEQARDDGGLILDLRGAGGGEVEMAYQVMARLTNAPLPGVRIQTRTPGTEEYKEKSFFIRPRGEWQFDLPLVMLVDQATYWPSQVLLYGARERPQMETVGYPSQGTKAVEPRAIGLSDERYAQIPTAIAWTPANVKLIGQPFEPGINLAHEPSQILRDSHDPVLARGAEEVFRMIGRLEWLREEERKRTMEEKLKKEN